MKLSPQDIGPALAVLLALSLPQLAHADTYNLKVVTDASPDYSDMDSMIHSIAGKWETPKDKLWAMFFWNHIARRQTAPTTRHGMALTDPIRQFNDYGYTMCSTIAGINCAIWDAMGFGTKYWDISLHTVPEVFYDDRWHMYDNSMSALYTLCDGVTIAGVEDIGKEGACEASGGQSEPGHIAKYHCLNATSPNGFLTGADCPRDLAQEYRCFNPNGLKYRYYFYDWDRGHRHILNVREGESYTRHYKSLGETQEFYVPNGGKDPEAVNTRYRIRGNGVWTFEPSLTAGRLPKTAVSMTNVKAVDPSGVEPVAAGEPAEVVFKINGANVITSQEILATFRRTSADDACSVAVSTSNGLKWTDVWTAGATGEVPAEVKLTDEVNGAYEVLVRVTLSAQRDPSDCALLGLSIRTTTMLNSKTQPKLNVGRNTIYVGAGDQTESIVLWPELQAGKYKETIVEEKNVTSTEQHPGYQGTIHPTAANEDAYLVYRLDAPGDLTRLTFGGRFYNRAPKSRCDLLYSLDAGKTWVQSWSLTDTEPPWDVIHYETVDIPEGHRAVWVRYRMNTTDPSPSGCSIYAVRMEADYVPEDATFHPLEVTFNWSEPQADRTLVERSHTQRVDELPAKYTINVGGEDLPVMNWLCVSAQGAVPDLEYGYSDGNDVGGERYRHRWVTYGENLAVGKPYTVSVPSKDNWGAGDPEGTKLTDGIAGPPYAGGINPSFGVLWEKGDEPEITVDLGAAQECGAFRINVGGGWPWWDALKGEVEDEVEVLTSLDGNDYTSHGFVDTDLRLKDIPINHLLPDEETLGAHLFELIPPQPVEARYVRYKITPQRMVSINEVQVLEFIRYEPFDLRIALPDERTPGSGEQPKVLTPAGRPVPAAQAAKNTARPLGEPVLDPPTLHSLGTYWLIGGDENKNASVAVQYREAGAAQWRDGPPLFRVEKGAHKNDEGESELDVPDDAWLFAGSLVLLMPDTEYELRLDLTDPDGAEATKTLTAKTIAEPVAPATMRTLHVVPGNGGGAGTAADPYRGLETAQGAAQPGDLFLVHAGEYTGTFVVSKSGEPGKPIIWRGAGDGEAVLDGQGEEAQRPGRGISANDVNDVWFEGLTVRNADYGVVAHNCSRIVVRGCHIHNVEYGLTCTNNSSGNVRDFFVADNLIEGPSTWPPTKGIEDARGIQVTGSGHVVCYNRIRGFADAIDTFPSVRCTAIDFHNNDISEMTDDGIEMDYSERNTRCFHNRLTNVFQGISVQPIFGGPVYIFRNAMYNVGVESFKMHNSPSGALMFHNTSVKRGPPLVLWTSEPVRNCVYRNNLFIGTAGEYAYETTAPMEGCDFDFDGFGGGPFGKFLKWNDTRYDTLEDVRGEAPVYTHAVLVDPATAFRSGLLPPEDEKRQFDAAQDLRLKTGTAAIDAGEVLPGFNDGFQGQAPDLGAHEFGVELPHYGPRRRP